MKVLVVGSTGGSGQAAVESLLACGHEVTAFSRRADEIPLRAQQLRFINGDVMNREHITRAVAGHDAVIVTLGIRENPLRVRLFGPARTPLNVRSGGTKNVVDAMRAAGVQRLIVQTSYGVGNTRERLGFVDRLFFALLLRPQIADTELQERVVDESGLDYVLVRPVHLTDAAEEPGYVSAAGNTGRLKVSRKTVGRFLAQLVDDATYTRTSVALSSGEPDPRAVSTLPSDARALSGQARPTREVNDMGVAPTRS